MAWAVHRFQIDQYGIDNPTDFDQLLPLPAVAGEARHLSSRYRADFAETHLRHHAFEPRSGDHAGGGPAQVFIHDLDLTPTQVLQAILHRILQPLTFEVVSDLVGGRLANIQNRLPLHMLRLDLVTHHTPPASGRRREPGRRAAAAVGPATRSSFLGCRAGTSETTDA